MTPIMATRPVSLESLTRRDVDLRPFNRTARHVPITVREDRLEHTQTVGSGVRSGRCGRSVQPICLDHRVLLEPWIVVEGLRERARFLDPELGAVLNPVARPSPSPTAPIPPGSCQ